MGMIDIRGPGDSCNVRRIDVSQVSKDIVTFARPSYYIYGHKHR